MEKRSCPVQALEPMKVLGLMKPESGKIFLAIFVPSRMMNENIFLWLFISLVLAIGFEKATAGQPGNYLFYSWNAFLDGPFGRKYLHGVAKVLSGRWREQGLLPPCAAQRVYEP
jgi:hypothetical protein